MLNSLKRIYNTVMYPVHYLYAILNGICVYLSQTKGYSRLKVMHITTFNLSTVFLLCFLFVRADADLDEKLMWLSLFLAANIFIPTIMSWLRPAQPGKPNISKFYSLLILVLLLIALAGSFLELLIDVTRVDLTIIIILIVYAYVKLSLVLFLISTDVDNGNTNKQSETA